VGSPTLLQPAVSLARRGSRLRSSLTVVAEQSPSEALWRRAWTAEYHGARERVAGAGGNRPLV